MKKATAPIMRRLRFRVALLRAGLRAARHRSNLTRLAQIYRTDKLKHGYIPLYDRHFCDLRAKEITLLEIGIGGYADPWTGGGSLRVWAAYFRRGRIFGLDIEDKKPHASRRIAIHKGNQADSVVISRLLKDMGQPDIVIDDGSHRSRDVIASFEALFPHMAPGGIYVVEDTQTSYWAKMGGSMNPMDPTTMNYFKGLADGLNFAEFPLADYEPNEFDQTIVGIHFYHNLIFIEKGRNNRPSNVAKEDRIAAGQVGV